jgi:hypothetical protein
MNPLAGHPFWRNLLRVEATAVPPPFGVDPTNVALSAQAGTNIEPSVAEEWARRLRAGGWHAFPHMLPTPAGPRPLGFPGWANLVFPGQRAPDLIAVHPGRRVVLVGDVTAQPRSGHLRKTIGYARQLARAFRPDNRYAVLAQERYWGTPLDRARILGILRTNVSPRFLVRPGREAESKWSGGRPPGPPRRSGGRRRPGRWPCRTCPGPWSRNTQVYGPGGSCADCIRAGRAWVCPACDNGFVGPRFACNNCGNRGQRESFAAAPAGRRRFGPPYPPLPLLRSGSRGAAVGYLQSVLNVWAGRQPVPLAPLVEDAVFGPRTLQRVRSFQQTTGIPADGVVGPQTWSRLSLVQIASPANPWFCAWLCGAVCAATLLDPIPGDEAACLLCIGACTRGSA